MKGQLVLPPVLKAMDVHVWVLYLDLPERDIRNLAALLSPEEASRVERLAFESDRRRYISAHGLLRRILAFYVEGAAAQLEIVRDPNRKPRLAGSPRIRFNLSHSANLAMLAVTANREVGVDLEQIRSLDDMDGLAATCFTPHELAEWNTLSGSERQTAFFTTWARKEAYLKALGCGLARPLESFEVSVLLGDPVLLRDAASQPGRWTIRDIVPAGGFAAAIAVEGPVDLPIVMVESGRRLEHPLLGETLTTQPCTEV